MINGYSQVLREALAAVPMLLEAKKKNKKKIIKQINVLGLRDCRSHGCRDQPLHQPDTATLQLFLLAVLQSLTNSSVEEHSALIRFSANSAPS